VFVARFLPSSIRRALWLVWMRLRHVLEDAPLLFFGVLIGVTLTFRIAVGWAHDASTPPVVAPTFVIPGPPPAVSVAPETPAREASTSVSGTAETKVAVPRVAPKPRGHGRRPLR
jgi:hypothetical protein